jgi:hypothetical protein
MRRSHLTKMTQEMSDLIQEKAPQVGIFWIHPETRKLIAPFGEPKEKGHEIPELQVIDCRATHPQLWETVKSFFPDLSHLKMGSRPQR